MKREELLYKLNRVSALQVSIREWDGSREEVLMKRMNLDTIGMLYPNGTCYHMPIEKAVELCIIWN